MIRVAVLDDWMQAAGKSADWGALEGRCEVTFFNRPIAPADAAEVLQDFDAIVPMRDRMAFPAPVLASLPRLKLLALTGFNAPHVDLAYCRDAGIHVCGSGIYSPAATAELTMGLILAALRSIPEADRAVREGRFQHGLALGETLDGKMVGIVGLGKLGRRVAALCQAFGAQVLAWSANLTAAAAQEAGATLVEKHELFARSDIVSLHLVHSARTHGIVGVDELAAMRAGALLVNTARAGLVDQRALLNALSERRIRVALDVFAQEPVDANDPLLKHPGSVLAPHLGFSTVNGFRAFYRQTVENIAAFIDGQPIRLLGA